MYMPTSFSFKISAEWTHKLELNESHIYWHQQLKSLLSGCCHHFYHLIVPSRSPLEQAVRFTRLASQWRGSNSEGWRLTKGRKFHCQCGRDRLNVNVLEAKKKKTISLWIKCLSLKSPGLAKLVDFNKFCVWGKTEYVPPFSLSLLRTQCG